MNIVISEVEIVPIKPKDGLVAFASVVINDALYLSSIGIHAKLSGGYRLTYPTKRLGLRQLNVFHPINAETSRMIEEAILAQYELLVERRFYVSN